MEEASPLREINIWMKDGELFEWHPSHRPVGFDNGNEMALAWEDQGRVTTILVNKSEMQIMETVNPREDIQPETLEQIDKAKEGKL